jgi:hypothetical protein
MKASNITGVANFDICVSCHDLFPHYSDSIGENG